MKKYSISQLKKFNADPAAWWWKYILGIDSPGNPEAFCLWNLAEHRLCTHEDKYEIMEDYKLLDDDKVIEWYDIIKSNAEWLPCIEWETQLFVEGDIWGYKLIWYIDVLQGDTIIDIKTSRYLSKEWWWVNMRSGLTSYEEYELQLWFYMKATGKRLAQIIEVAKHDYKKKGEWHSRQVIDFNRTDEMDKKRTNRSLWLLEEMNNLHNKFKFE